MGVIIDIRVLQLISPFFQGELSFGSGGLRHRRLRQDVKLGPCKANQFNTKS
jgi:hypothetical protein